MLIYTITVLNRHYNARENHHKTRTIGYYFDCNDAILTTLFDRDIFENGYYDTAVIEEVPQGTHPFRKDNQLWFDMSGTVIDTPDFYKNCCCIGIG